jgi:hypothetical protein
MDQLCPLAMKRALLRSGLLRDPAGVFELLRLHASDQFRVGIPRQNPVELISIVVDEAHVLDKHIVNSPLAVNVMQPVIDGKLHSFLIDHSGSDFCVVSVHCFA